MLLGGRAAQGLGAACMMSLAMALVADIVPATGTGRAMGLLGTMSAIGTTLGPSLGGALTARFGWESIFLVNVPFGLVALVLTQGHLPPDRSKATVSGRRVDVPGTLLLTASLVAYGLAMTLGGSHWDGVNTLLVLAALGGAAGFLVVETRTGSPLIELSLLRAPGVAPSLVASALVATVMMTTLVVGPFYLSRALGLSAGVLGLALSVGPLVAVLAGVPAGRLVDRFGARRISQLGLAGLAAGELLVGVLPSRLGIPGYLVPLVGMTACYAMFQAANNTLLMTSIEPHHRGVAAGLLGLARNLGLITGASAMGAVLAWGTGSDVTSAHPDAVAAGARMAFRVATVLIVIALGAVGFGARLTGALTPLTLPLGAIRRRADFLIPGSLVLLSIVPVAAGLGRLIELAGDPLVTAANARFVARPLPVVLHIVGVIPYSLLGAFQFAPAFRRRAPRWHRAVGGVVAVLGLTVGVTGMWMAQSYAWPKGDGVALYVLRMVLGSATIFAIVAGLAAIGRRDFAAHGRWMLRAYAIAMGAGTQVFTHLPWFILFGEPGEFSRTLLMAAGWGINLIVAEGIIRRVSFTDSRRAIRVHGGAR
jgi:MFS family permease